MNDFKLIVRKRRIRWLWMSLVVIILLMSILLGFTALLGHFLFQTTSLLGSPQSQLLSFWVALIILISFLAGQTIRGVEDQSWDSWIAQLGPQSIKVLISVLQTTLDKSK